MENAPLIPEDDAEKTPDKDKKKKSRPSWISLVGEHEPKKPALVERASEKPVEAEAAPEAEAELEAEPVPEAEAPDEEVGEIEKPVVEQGLVEVIREIEAEQAPDPITDPPVEYFRDLIESGKDSGMAYEKVMAELGVEPEPPTTGEELVFDRAIETEPMENIESDEPPPPPAGDDRRGPGGLNPNLVLRPAAPDTQPEEPEYYRQASPAAMALFGGIIGYLIGRRRGRIKTEKKLLPVQKKLEKQVTNLQFELQEKEKKIRQVAAEKVGREGPSVIEVFKKPVTEKLAEERHKAPEAQQLHSPHHEEHIGQVLIAATEAKPIIKTEKYVEPLTEKRVETLNRTELLSLSEKIIVDGSNLHEIYKTHLIGERGLRRLIAEHLRGGDLTKALRREIVEREIDFERDPGLRDMSLSAVSGGGTGATGGKAALNQLLEKAEASVPVSNEEAAFFKARVAYDSRQFQQQRKQRRLVDIALTVLILALLGVVIFLALGHR